MLARFRRWLLSGMAAGALALPLLGQGPEVTAFAGRVRDEQGQPLVGATVMFRGLDFDVNRQTQTDKDGRFYDGGFRVGRYQVSVLRGGEVLWSFAVSVPPFREVTELEIDLKKLREAAEQMTRLDPELERQRQEELERRQHEDNLKAHLNRGSRHLNQGRPEEAVAEFQAALALEPKRGATHGLLAAAVAAAGRDDEAIEHYRRALEVEPQEAAHHNNLGTVLARQGKLEEALFHFEKAAQLDPERASTYQFNRGAALLNAGRPAEALPVLRQATRTDPTLAVAHYFLGLALVRSTPRLSGAPAAERVEPPPGAVEAFQHYLQLAPEGEYAPPARDYLKRLGALPPESVLPTIPLPEIRP